MKTVISIRKPLLDAADRLAHRMGVSRSVLFQRAIEAFLQAHTEVSVTEALDQLYGSLGSECHLETALECLQTDSLPPTEEW